MAAKRKSTAARSSVAEARSGATGGPSAGAGLNFQVDFAIIEAIELIGRSVTNPLENGQLTMEPRARDRAGTVTCWDVYSCPPAILTEAKLSVTRHDVLEWLERIVEFGDQPEACEFQLFYSRGGSRLIIES